MLLLGPTGVGKTHLVRALASLVGVPLVRADATKFSATGYVGRDVDDAVRELVSVAGGDVALAEHGIVCVDEVDKLCGPSAAPGGGGADALARALGGGGGGAGKGSVNTKEVQTGLLRLLDADCDGYVSEDDWVQSICQPHDAAKDAALHLDERWERAALARESALLESERA